MSFSPRTSKLFATLALSTALMAVPLFAPAAVAQTEKPNILFIMGDDIGWMQVGQLPTRAGARRNAQH